MSRELIVNKIKDGTVIDHIDAGRALYVLKILGITGREGRVVAVVMNVESKKIGRKDIVKVEGLKLKKEQVDKIALIAPHSTINIVEKFEVIKKYKVRVPDILEDLLRCMNPNCITNQPREPIKPVFYLQKESPLVFKCKYCGAKLAQDEIIRQLIGE
ncbi:MAG TPA: aspartate carbamoyltransferase regulatory subunit [Thermofilum sp.]|nr:aspartate carbamoyltransferase regulatory subunit [Thermofilum sp.]